MIWWQLGLIFGSYAFYKDHSLKKRLQTMREDCVHGTVCTPGISILLMGLVWFTLALFGPFNALWSLCVPAPEEA